MKQLILLIFIFINFSLFALSTYEKPLEPEHATPESIEFVLDKYKDRNHKVFSNKDDVLFFIAQECKQPESIIYLLEIGADPNITDKFGVNALDKYRKNKNRLTYVEESIYKSIDKNDPVNILKYGSSEDIDKLFLTKKSINKKISRYYPIEWITLFNSESVLEGILKKYSFNINKTPDLILSSLRYDNYSVNKIDILVKYGFDINGYRRKTFFSYHASYNINSPSFFVKEYPILYALRNRFDEDIIRCLIDNGSIVNAVDGKFNKHTLHLSFSYITDRDILSVFIKGNKNLNRRDKYGRTPIYYAMDSQPLENIKFLVDSGCDLNASFKKDGQPLNRGMYSDDSNKIIYVIENTDNVNTKTDSTTSPLFKYLNSHSIDNNTDIEVLRELVKKGANLNDYNWGRTPLLQYCLLGNDINIVKYLIESGADPNLKDENNRSLIDYMEDNDYLRPYIPEISISYMPYEPPLIE